MAQYLKDNLMKNRPMNMKCSNAWSNNGLVKTLSNYLKSIIIANGVTRKKMGEDNKVREKHQLSVNSSMQMLIICTCSIKLIKKI